MNIRRWLFVLSLLLGLAPEPAHAASSPLPADSTTTWKWGGSTRKRGFQVAALGMALGLFIMFKPSKRF